MSDAVEIIAIRGNDAEIRVGDRVHIVPFIVRGSEVSFAFDGEIYTVETAAASGSRARAKHRDHLLDAPMPGMVLKILVQPGSVVTKGAPLIILEAMKMEHTVTAPRDGTIATVNCREGEMVQPGVDLVTMA
jgi:3-methylcrotonyl-CoA carboxylase alpha subunit